MEPLVHRAGSTDPLFDEGIVPRARTRLRSVELQDPTPYLHPRPLSLSTMGDFQTRSDSPSLRALNDINDPSELARALFTGRWPDWSPSARVQRGPS